MKNFITRALTGVIFVMVIVVGISWHPLTFLFLLSLITGLILWEFYGLVKDYGYSTIKRAINCLGGVYLFIASFCHANGMTGRIIFFPYILFILYVLVIELYNKKSNPLYNWAFTFFAQIYCAGSFSLLNFIAIPPDNTLGLAGYTPIYILAIFIFIWLNDTGAYLVGSLFGKHRLFERISPKKSWEGFIGGLSLTLISSQLFFHFLPETGRIHWLGLSAIIVIFGTWGDLVESLLKRTLQIKDSGNCFPGHGGMLDRFDSIMLAIPAAYIYIEIFIRS